MPDEASSRRHDFIGCGEVVDRLRKLIEQVEPEDGKEIVFGERKDPELGLKGAQQAAMPDAQQAAQAAETPAGKDAIAWLEKVSQDIPVAARQRPQGFMDDETFRTTCAAKIRELMK